MKYRGLTLTVKEMPGWLFSIEMPSMNGHGGWRFSGSDLTSRYLDPERYGFGEYEDIKPESYPELTTWTVTLTVRDSRDLPMFSRGPNTLQAKSAPTVLRLATGQR